MIMQAEMTLDVKLLACCVMHDDMLRKISSLSFMKNWSLKYFCGHNSSCQIQKEPLSVND